MLRCADKFRLVLTTVGNEDNAKTIARSLVSSGLAACVNILNPIHSVYRWEKKVEEDTEWLLLIKTHQELVPKVQKIIEKLHNYDVPEILSLPLNQGSDSYLQWLLKSLTAMGSTS